MKMRQAQAVRSIPNTSSSLDRHDFDGDIPEQFHVVLDARRGSKTRPTGTSPSGRFFVIQTECGVLKLICFSMKTKRFQASLNDNYLFMALKIQMRLPWNHCPNVLVIFQFSAQSNNVEALWQRRAPPCVYIPAKAFLHTIVTVFQNKERGE